MNVTSKILAAGLSMAFVLSSVLPSQAFTPRANANPIQQQDVVKAQYLQDSEGGNFNRYNQQQDEIYIPRRKRGGYYQGRDYRNYERQGRNYRNYDRRGYRDSYRYNRRNRDGAAIFGGLAAGAIIGGIIANENRPVYRERRVYRERASGNAHVNWCYSRYRSYRAYDNSFQPNNGPRRACYSPYS